MAIMAVNSFVRDCEDPNPLIRALTVRTMGCIRADKITEYLCEPLHKCLKDEDPYVWKTAAVCVAKLHDINAQMVEDQGLLDSLWDLIADSNPMVVANAVVALSEINGREAQSICEQVTPQLSHAYSAVMLSVVKVLMKFLELLPKDSDYYNVLLKKPETLKQEIKAFFVKYNDPIHVKLEKLDIMIHLASQVNIAQVLAELKEYATETKVNYVVQEAIIVIRDIFRKYPNKYESIIATLCENLDLLDEPDAQAAMIWIVGEYAERIDNTDELLESFLEGFHNESTQEQLALLTAIVKLFLKKPSEIRELVQQLKKVLSEKPLISEETDLSEPTLLDKLICHIGSLAPVFHKLPNVFVEESHGIHRKHLPIHHGSTDAGDSPVGTTTAMNLEQPQVIPSQGDLLGDL
ncbi:AP-2 complex subunit beta [Saguinus oedipus]|uniref:AP-2 complex subunit beta n=1 Tax=Saguinus oedipus TaxID=9490 RepID=A0ABQ9TFM4_SAGOE|nr:AP-2 complex subunit beta [Saguinus oedipus]